MNCLLLFIAKLWLHIEFDFDDLCTYLDPTD